MKPRRAGLALAAIVAAGFLLRVGAAYHLWRAFDAEFPRVWETSGQTLSQDGTQYVLQAGPSTWNAPLFRGWAAQPFYRPPLASYYFIGLLRAVRFDRLAASAVQAALAMAAYVFLFGV